MKKIYFLLSGALIVLLITRCKKDENTEYREITPIEALNKASKACNTTTQDQTLVWQKMDN